MQLQQAGRSCVGWAARERMQPQHSPAGLLLLDPDHGLTPYGLSTWCTN
jgi:hypothetical protein